MSTVKVSNKSLKRYFGFLKNIDVESKRNLIAQLSNSIEPNKQGSKGIDHLYGAWEDDRTAEAIIAEIKSSRTSNPQIEGFE